MSCTAPTYHSESLCSVSYASDTNIVAFVPWLENGFEKT